MGREKVQEMTSFLKNLNFWKKFSKHLLTGISVMVILAVFQTAPTPLIASHACVSVPARVNILYPSNNQAFNTGTPNVNVQWSADPNTDSYRVTVIDNHTNSTIASTSITTGSYMTPALENGHSYTVQVIPENRCGSGASNQVSFTVSPTQTAQLSCTISQRLIGPQGNAYLYELTGSSSVVVSDIKSWEWYLVNEDGLSKFNTGQTIHQTFFASTPVRLVVTNMQNRTGSCDTFITLPATQPGTTVPATCSQYTNTQSRCFANNQRCSVNVTFNTNNICNNRTEGQPYGCYSDASCGTGDNNQCRSIHCTPSCPGGYFSGGVTHTCNSNVQLTCGQLICPTSSAPSSTNQPNNIDVAATSSSSSNSSSTSSATGGGGGTANVTINE